MTAMRRHGLVVGIDRYRTLRSLSKAAADAEVIAQVLEAQGEFKITRLPEAVTADGRLCVDPEQEVSTAAIKKAIADLFAPQAEDHADTGLFFFAGHGLREQIGLREGYLAASDCDPAAERWGLSLSWLQRLLRNSPVRSQIIWLDCCHSGELLNLSAADPGGLNRCFIAASRSFEDAYEQVGGPHGVLTGALLQGLAPERQLDGRVSHFTLADVVNRALEKESQHPVCNNSGEPIVLTRTSVPRLPVSRRFDVCPFKGLEFFDCNATDPDFFYGRNALVDQLVERVRTGNFVAVTGVSGSGKSSAVRAGLLHQLRLGQRLAGSERWQLTTMLPGEHPLESLSEALRDTPGVGIADLSLLLATGSIEALIRIVNLTARQGRLVLVIDQFEELFTRCADEVERERFLECLLGAQGRVDCRLTVVIALRLDFFGKCAERAYAGLVGRIQEGLVTLLPMSIDELRAAVVEPARQVGLEVDEALVAEIIATVHGEPGALPLLEYTLTELWKRCREMGRLSRDEYARLGGVQGALEKRAEAVFGELTPTEQEAAKWIFLALTQPGEGTEDTRRRQPKTALTSMQRVPEVTESTIEKLTEARLLVTGKTQGRLRERPVEVDIIDVAHESLIRSWPRLRRWIEENRAFHRWRVRLTELVSEWGDRWDPGLLLRGARLIEAESFSAEYGEALTSSEAAFIAASVEQRQDEQRAREAQLKALDEQRNRALRMQSLFLTDLARQQNDRYDYCLGLLLALEALPSQRSGQQRPLVPQAFKELYRSAVNLQRLQLLDGGAGVIDAAFDPAGQWLVTTGDAGRALAWDLDTGEQLALLEGHSDAVNCSVVTPDGRRLVTGSFDGTARLWDTRNWSLIGVLSGHEYGINACLLSRSGTLMLTVSSDTTARLWETERGNCLAVLEGHQGVLFSGAFSADEQRVVTVSKDCTARLWDTANGVCLQVFEGHQDAVFSASFSPDGRQLLTASSDGTARLWDIQRSNELTLLKGHQDSINAAAFSPNGKRIVTASQDGSARLWEPGQRKPVAVLTGHVGGIADARFSADSRLLVTAGQDGTTRLWETGGGEMISVLTGARDRISTATFDSAGQRVASVSLDGSIRIWRVQDREQLGVLWGHDGGVYSAAFHPYRAWIATGSMDRLAYLWDAETGQILRPFKGHESSVYSTTFSPDGRFLLTASRDCTARLWSVAHGTQAMLLQGHQGSVFKAVFSPDGRSILTASQDGSAYLWDAHTGVKRAELTGHGGGVNYATFSLDGGSAATASEEGKVRFWTLSTRPTCEMLSAHSAGINELVFSPDGRLFATASNDGTTTLWDAAARRALRTLTGHQGAVYSVAFSPDGRRLLTSASDCTARLWDLDSGEELAVLASHTDGVNSVTFSPDGQRMVTASHDRSVRVWRALPIGQDLIAYARAIAPRDLTEEERRRYFIE